jgi:maltooligosyltrehalose trehalohydrolase
VRRGAFVLVANFSRRPSHVPLEETAEPVVAAGHITLEPGYVVLTPLSGALLRVT